jgi:hypothetical protein
MGFERKVMFVNSAGTPVLVSIQTKPKEERIAKVTKNQAKLREQIPMEQRQRDKRF